ncbi:MAG: YqiA/YcfP family alpha/beta fold hydrolase, partial [Myxococcota bacterium]
MRCLYLHGFLGSPASAKARLFEERARRRGWTIEVPDLNVPDFRSLTITRVVELAASIVVPGQRWAVIGSSMGGWAAAHFASLHPERVSGLVLMCPAFNMPSLLEEQLGPDGLERWRSSGTIAIEHSGLGGVRELGYSFLVDAREWA